MEYFIKTKRLYFRKWCEDDLQLAMALWGDYRVTKLFDSRGTLSKEEVKLKLLSEIENEVIFRVQYWPFFDQGSDAFIGACGLRHYKKEEGVFEIGFHVCSSHWGNGYATEAAKEVIKYSFNTLNIKGLFAGHNPKNEASEKLLKKLGFKYTHDEYYEPTKLMHPSYTYEL